MPYSNTFINRELFNDSPPGQTESSGSILPVSNLAPDFLIFGLGRFFSGGGDGLPFPYSL